MGSLASKHLLTNPQYFPNTDTLYLTTLIDGVKTPRYLKAMSDRPSRGYSMETGRERNWVGSKIYTTRQQGAMLAECEFQKILKKAVACKKTLAIQNDRCSEDLVRRDVNSDE